MSSERPRRKTDLPPDSAGGEDEFIAAMAAGAGGHPPQLEAAGPVEIEYLLGFGHLERIAADPVDDVSPRIHAADARSLVRLPGVEGLAAAQVPNRGRAPEPDQGRQQNRPFERSGRTDVG